MNQFFCKTTFGRVASLFAVVFVLGGCARDASNGVPTLQPATPAPTKPPTAVAQQPAPATAVATTPMAPTQVPPPTATPLPAPTATPLAPAPVPTFPPYLITPGAVKEPDANPQPKPPKSSSGCQVYYYTVRPGDNLFRIGLRYDTTAYAIARQNGIPDVRMINPGRRLKITVCS